ncbi:MAG: VOC family protein, partial [Pseudomonadota bacterium]
MNKLGTLMLRATDPDAERCFYREVLGMANLSDECISYSEQELAIHFTKAEEPYDPQPTDLYWKIALSVPNVELACAQLRAAGVDCSEPQQFRDVGYLAKATDPEGFVIELIDHWFQGDRPDTPIDETLLGGGAHLSLLTLRTADIASVEREVLSWGMVPLSVQPVDPFGFTLHFYAFTDERPPNDDLTAIENRPWLYQRPYTVLEIQHVHALDRETQPSSGAAGYGGFTIA